MDGVVPDHGPGDPEEALGGAEPGAAAAQLDGLVVFMQDMFVPGKIEFPPGRMRRRSDVERGLQEPVLEAVVGVDGELPFDRFLPGNRGPDTLP